MKCLNIGCGNNPIISSPDNTWVNLDKQAVCADVLYDLDRPFLALPFDDNSFDRIYASHILEHIVNILPLMKELYRIAKPGGELMAKVPYGSSNTAYEDPQHVRYYFESSWLYYSQTAYGGADYGYRGDWQTMRIRLSVIRRGTDTILDSDETLQAIRLFRNVVDEMTVYMSAVKPAREPGTGVYNPTLELKWSQQE